ncbi:MAG: thioesterase [Nocardioides sp.]|nr:thioesterase [Nocardioides sp.]
MSGPSSPGLAGAALRERVDTVLGVPLVRALSIGLLDEDDPAAGARMPVTELAGNGFGGSHSAAMSALMEAAGYLALAPTLSVTEHAVTQSSALSLLAPAGDGRDVVAVGTVDRRGRRAAYVSVVATVDDRLVARMQVVKAVVPLR